MILAVLGVLASVLVFLPVSAQANWTVGVQSVTYFWKDETLEVRANLTRSNDIQLVEMCYYFVGQSQPVNVTMKLLGNSTSQESESTLWFAEIRTPSSEFNMSSKLYVTTTSGTVITLPIGSGVMSDQMTSEVETTLPSIPLEDWIIPLLLVAIILPIALRQRRNKRYSQLL